MFSDDEEENKIKKDSKIFINLSPGHLLFFIYLVSFLRGLGGWVSGWEGRGGVSLKTRSTMKNTKVTGVRLTNEMKPGPMDHHIGRRL